MTTFTRTWNAAYESSPADSNNVSEGATRIREFKNDVRERIEVDHEYGAEAAATSEAGYHKKVTFREQSGDPTVPANNGALYTKDVAGVTELFWKDSAGTVYQLTSGGTLALPKSVNTWTKGQALAEYNIGTTSGTVTPDLNNGNAQRVTISGGNLTVNPPSNPVTGATLSLRVINDSTPRTITFNASFKKTLGLSLSLTATASAQDLFVMYYNGSNWCIISVAKAITTSV